MKKMLWMVVAAMMATVTLTACSDDDDDNGATRKPVALKCVKPDYLKAGDKVALISPSYFTPMENVEKTADVLRSWGLEPVIGPNVGKVVDGRYAGTDATSTLMRDLLLGKVPRHARRRPHAAGRKDGVKTRRASAEHRNKRNERRNLVFRSLIRTFAPELQKFYL